MRASACRPASESASSRSSTRRETLRAEARALVSSSRTGSSARWEAGCGSIRAKGTGRDSLSNCRLRRTCEISDDGGIREHMATKVLVIDDEAPIRLLWRVNLEAEGMEGIEAADGPSGLERARAEAPHVILLDVMMPGLDGWRGAAERLHDVSAESIPIVFLTARAELRDRARGIDLGGVDYVTKPFNPVALAPLVRSLLGRVERGEREALRHEKLTELRALLERDVMR